MTVIAHALAYATARLVTVSTFIDTVTASETATVRAVAVCWQTLGAQIGPLAQLTGPCTGPAYFPVAATLAEQCALATTGILAVIAWHDTVVADGRGLAYRTDAYARVACVALHPVALSVHAELTG